MTRFGAVDCGTNSIRMLITDVRRGDDGVLELTELHRVMEIVRLGEGVDEVAIALLGGDPTGRGVRLRQEAVALQGRHLVANGGRRHTHAGRVGDVPGAHRLGGLDVLLHDGSEDGCLALVEHDHHLKVSLALDDTECQW